MTRDYQGEFKTALTEATPSGDYIRHVVAEKFVAGLLERDLDLLTGWLLDRAPALVADELRRIDSIQRGRNRAASVTRAFQDAASSGFNEGRNPFDVRYVVDDNATVRRLGDMTAADHLFVADNYERSGRRDLMLAAYHRALAKRVGAHRTEEVIRPDELAHPPAEAA